MNAAVLTHPWIIQGGMGVGVSDWRLARAVSMTGQLGVVSGTGIDTLFARRLQDGDPGGHFRRAMEAFPFRETVEDALEKFFHPEGRGENEPYRALPIYRKAVTEARERFTVLAAFAEVWLAREGHDGAVGINLLTKVQLPNLATLYGAIMAGVDYVLMGAGIPREIPGALDRLAAGEPATVKLDVEGAPRGTVHEMTFRPADHPDPGIPLDRPMFLPIVSSHALATVLARKANGRVDGFVVEAPTAGGHNAPPRGAPTYNDRGEPVYGERDAVDLEAMRALGLPFWLAGGSGRPGALQAAREAGAVGVQVGTLFAFCDESGFDPVLKAVVRRDALNREVAVVTDPVTSPTGFPFKVVQAEGTLSDPVLYEARERVCDLGYLRTPCIRPDGRLDYRCPAEPVEHFVKKGGAREETDGRVCLCNTLFAAIDRGQVRADGRVEPPLVTSGDDVNEIRHLLGTDGSGYTAAAVVEYLLGEA